MSFSKSPSSPNNRSYNLKSGISSPIRSNSISREKRRSTRESPIDSDFQKLQIDSLPSLRTTSSLQSLLSKPLTVGLPRYQLKKTCGQARCLIGFTNLGNTCFMNSILQCICSSWDLLGYFDSELFKSELNKRSPLKGQLALAFADLIQQALHSSYKDVISPVKFKQNIEKWAPQFMGYRQQDSQEFLRAMLDGLSEDLNRITEKKKWNIKDEEIDNLSDIEKATVSWNMCKSLNDSVITDVFAGQLQSTVTCHGCKYRSVTFEMFMDLSLPIPKNNASLHDCLEEFSKSEVLDDKFQCSKCKSYQKASKKLQIYKCPQVLVLHLKRFNFNSYSRDKLETLVNFPISNLDLKICMSSSSGVDVLHNYDLFGISNHMGSLGGGHYIAHILNSDDNSWYIKDDSSVTKINPPSPMSSAYVLFYRKK